MTIVTISISKESKRLIKPLIEKRKLSEWINEKIQKELSDEITIKKEILELTEKLKEKKESLKLIQDWNKQINEEITEEEKEELGIEEINYWKESIRILNDKPDLIQGRINLYNNIFNQNLNKQDYIKKLEKMKKLNSK